jgi:hypothetical protein
MSFFPVDLSTSSDSRSTRGEALSILSDGLHRLQGRYPALTASPGEGKNSTWVAFGFFAGHVGRQKMWVVFTPT